MDQGKDMRTGEAAARGAGDFGNIIGGIRHCTHCVLPETVPGISFDEQCVCQYCRERESGKPDQGLDRERDKSRRDHWRKEFLAMARGRTRGRDMGHDVLLAYSGGKDSTYTVHLLSQVFGLRVLALSVDNGFMSPGAMDNMRRVLDRLGVDHMLVRPSPPLMRALFRRSLERELYPARALLRASSVCTSCISVVKALVLKTAMDMRIPFVAYGWSPGQSQRDRCIIQHNRQLMRSTMGKTRDILVSAAGPGMAAYFPDLESLPAEPPREVHPLAFVEYDEERIKELIGHFGWRQPVDTDPNSTNCLLNALGNREHLRRYGFHPYALEIAGIVRAGNMTREEGLRKLQDTKGEAMADMVREMLYADAAQSARTGTDA